jgi:antibiotic biosynthesis monooxygenase (ABM) superfamily enzyme
MATVQNPASSTGKLASIAFAGLGLNDTRQEEMAQLFDSYVSWLSAASRIDQAPIWKQSVAIMSADYVVLAGQESSVGAASGAVGRKFPVEVSHADLLRSDSVVEMLLGYVGAGRS